MSRQFKVGDTVRCIMADAAMNKGDLGIVSKVHYSYKDYFEVKGISYWFHATHFELAKKEPKNKPGEYVDVSRRPKGDT